MKMVPDITHFMASVRVDPRVGPLHISLYMAIVYLWVQQGQEGPARISARDLMPLSKIAGLTPMYKCLRELDEYGYIVYEPSYNPAAKSRVFLPLLEEAKDL